MSTEKHVWVKKIFTNGQNIGLPIWTRVEKTVQGEETHWLSGKENVLGKMVSREGHVDSFLNMKGAITANFSEKIHLTY